MKKVYLALLVCSFFIAGCGSNNNESSSTETETTTQKSTSSTSISTSTTTSTTKESSSSNESSAVQASATLPSSETTIVNDPLAAYSDEQIEYARVWLTVMGTQYKQELAASGFELNVSFSPAGTAINPYDENSLTYPQATVTLSGKFSYQGLVVYSSNHDGSITQYNTPSHFQYPNVTEEDKAFLQQQEQAILDSATVVSIPVGNAEDIIELINVMNIYN